MFSQNIRIVYLYTVCFITLCMTVGGIIATVNAIVNYHHPQVWVHWVYEQERPFTEVGRPIAIPDYFVTSDEVIAIPDLVNPDGVLITSDFVEISEEITPPTIEDQLAEYQIRRAEQIAQDRPRRLRSIFNSLAVWVVALPVFLFHWVKIRKEEEEDASTR